MFEEVEISTMYADVYKENLFSITTMLKRGWVFDKEINEKISRYKGNLSFFQKNAMLLANKCTYKK